MNFINKTKFKDKKKKSKDILTNNDLSHFPLQRGIVNFFIFVIRNIISNVNIAKVG